MIDFSLLLLMQIVGAFNDGTDQLGLFVSTVHTIGYLEHRVDVSQTQWKVDQCLARRHVNIIIFFVLPENPLCIPLPGYRFQVSFGTPTSPLSIHRRCRIFRLPSFSSVYQ